MKPLQNTTHNPDLTVAISTLGAGVCALTADKLSPQEGVTYRVFVQSAEREHKDHAENALNRPDIHVHFLDTVGVTRSRNAAIAQTETQLLLFADDDLTFHTQTYDALRTAFTASPNLDFICARLADTDGHPFKTYPPANTPIKKTNCGRVGTPEIAIRVKPFRAYEISFDERFGAGTELYSGDEYIFLCDALKAGLRGMHMDLVVAAHPTQSTGHILSAESFMIREHVLRRALSPVSWPYRVAFAMKHLRKFPNWASWLRFIRP